MTPHELLDQITELEKRANDGRRYQYDRDAAARDLIELIPQAVDVFRDLLIDMERLEAVAEAAERLEAAMWYPPKSAEIWIRNLRSLQDLRAALERLEEIRLFDLIATVRTRIRSKSDE